jgi:hypothetical protein
VGNVGRVGRAGKGGRDGGAGNLHALSAALRCARAVPRGRGEQYVVSHRGETDEGRGETLEKRSR